MYLCSFLLFGVEAGCLYTWLLKVAEVRIETRGNKLNLARCRHGQGAGCMVQGAARHP